MPALTKSGQSAQISYLGVNPDRAQTLASQPVNIVQVGFAGFEGESHSGLTRPSCGRVANMFERGTEIRNTRQISMLSAEDLAEIATALDVANLPPEWLGANVVVSGLPDFSHVPPGSRLLARNGTCLVIDVQNRPCNLPARVIEAQAPGKGKAFKQAAAGLRGITAWVERPGVLQVGDTLDLFTPDQRPWCG